MQSQDGGYRQYGKYFDTRVKIYFDISNSSRIYVTLRPLSS